jgi:FlaA1/EpsC-like NDP-sugar epimerase
MENQLYPLTGRRILITGGTGSLGQALVRRILKGDAGSPEKVIVFSRDEAKQHQMRLEYQNLVAATDEVIYCDTARVLEFVIGDVRSYESLTRAVKRADVVIFASALKQVPTCEYFPYEGILTNSVGAQNLVRAVEEHGNQVEIVVGISTDKACKPVNVMGMTKALQERIFISANLNSKKAKFFCVRYGNVIASRGSVIPLFRQQIAAGKPLTVTSDEMTRFLLSLNQAVDVVFNSIRHCHAGEIFVPRLPSARILDLAEVIRGDRDLPILITGVRPGEKLHEILVSEEEAFRTVDMDGYLIIQPILPELRAARSGLPTVNEEYSSANGLIEKARLRDLINEAGILNGDTST